MRCVAGEKAAAIQSFLAAFIDPYFAKGSRMPPVAQMEPSPVSDITLYNTHALEAPIYCRYYNSKVQQRLWTIAQVGQVLSQRRRSIVLSMCSKIAHNLLYECLFCCRCHLSLFAGV